MPAGRPTLPTQQKILQGTYRKDRANESEIFPDRASNLQAPKWLAKKAREKWSELAPILSRNGLLTECDLDSLAIYCQTWIRYVDAENKLNKGSTTTAASGYQQVNAWITIAKNCRADLMKLGDRLGLSPSARGRINTEPVDEGDEFIN